MIIVIAIVVSFAVGVVSGFACAYGLHQLNEWDEGEQQKFDSKFMD